MREVRGAMRRRFLAVSLLALLATPKLGLAWPCETAVPMLLGCANCDGGNPGLFQGTAIKENSGLLATTYVFTATSQYGTVIAGTFSVSTLNCIEAGIGLLGGYYFPIDLVWHRIDTGGGAITMSDSSWMYEDYGELYYDPATAPDPENEQ